MLKPVYSASDTTQNVEILPVASFKKANTKGADQTAQMRALVCMFVVCMQQSVFSPRCPILFNLTNFHIVVYKLHIFKVNKYAHVYLGLHSVIPMYAQRTFRIYACPEGGGGGLDPAGKLQ